MSATTNADCAEKSCCGPTCCTPAADPAPKTAPAPEELVRQVRERYSRIAEGEISGCCGPQTSGCAAPESAVARGIGYSETGPRRRAEGGEPRPRLRRAARLPRAAAGRDGARPRLRRRARRASSPRAGRRHGRVIGVDMTPEMLEQGARRTRRRWAPRTSSSARGGSRRCRSTTRRSTPSPATASSTSCPTSRRSSARSPACCKPGGRLVVSDIVLDGRLPDAIAEGPARLRRLRLRRDAARGVLRARRRRGPRRGRGSARRRLPRRAHGVGPGRGSRAREARQGSDATRCSVACVP